MKAFLPLVFLVGFAVTPAPAQYAMRTGSLGGSLSSRAFSHPLGGFAPSGNRNFRGFPRTPLGYPYAYSVWVPDYFDYLDAQSQYASPYGYSAAYGFPPGANPYGPPPVTAQAPQQPVIINQYFSTPPAQQTPASAPETNNTAAQAPGNPIGTPTNYYLIAYKNHEVYSALAYWVEDKTLHYVTTQNTHNQASLDLIDLALTKSLNQRNDVPFSLTGQSSPAAQ
ncbi:MAG TPA: hypothetical protein VHY84_20320 [Bryobacteraceae bacterium]|jgi:hypothetical protein|nr:hypothetical protein [Bryobacteraceae bacterium]